ncbi:helix-turn-helix domain-containing protein [uncultured Sneathia sp.]|nr:helix-turn-helix domain-containing protein [uncultured Sneathia sp.]
MILPEEIKRLRTRCFLKQEDFAKKLGVAFSTVNRWEQGKSKPNLVAIKQYPIYRY